MDLSQLSAIHTCYEPADLAPRRVLFDRSSLESSRGMEGPEPGPGGDTSTSSAASFRTCPDASQLAAALASSRVSVGQEFLHTDHAASVSLLEVRRPSLLAVALEDGAVLDQLQGRTLLGSSLTADGSLSRTYILERSRRREVVEEVAADPDLYPAPLAASLRKIAVITRQWAELAAMEEEMAAPFNNISDEVAATVKLLTRETACKASFNYLLLDPQVTRNLPRRVFSTDDQALWAAFVAAVFYVGKGSRSRPFHHLYDAVKEKKTKKKPLSAKIAKIRGIWEAGSGVVVVQVFHNTIAVEAFTREAAIIDAVGCSNLTNEK
jgi:hypothetical protein